MNTAMAPVLTASPTAGRRHLRVGIVQGPRIVEERVVRAAETVTIGARAGCMFVLPPDVLARPWRLFEHRRGRFVLRLGPGMSARVAAAGQITAFEPPEASEGPRAIVLADGARGKVMLADTTILFQLVRPPAAQPRPQLPVSVRRRVLGDLDGVFAAFLAASFLLHLVMVVYLRHVDWPRRPALDELPDRFVQMVRRPRPAPVGPRPVATPSSKPAAKPLAAARPKATTPPAAAKPQQSAEDRHAALQKQVQNMGMLRLLTTVGEGKSLTDDLLNRGAPDQAVDEAFKHLGGVAVATSDDLNNLRRATAGSGKIATPADLRGGARIADAARAAPVGEREVKTSLQVDPPVIEEGHADAAAIAREMRSRRKAVSACYERALKQQPTLAGKLVVRFSLAAAGTVTAVELDEDTLGAPEVFACIRATALRWRFPPLAEGTAVLSFPFVFQPGG